jgi:type IV secretory pathway VirB2 component (pilin)
MRNLSVILIYIASIIAGLSIAAGTSEAACLFNWSCTDNTNGLVVGAAPIPYCLGNECTLSGGLNAAKTASAGLFTTKSISTYAVDIVQYFLGFVTLIAVIYIIYAGFQIMTGGGDEEKMKKSRNTILYVFIGIVIMWLAYALVTLVMTALKNTAYE